LSNAGAGVGAGGAVEHGYPQSWPLWFLNGQMPQTHDEQSVFPLQKQVGKLGFFQYALPLGFGKQHCFTCIKEGSSVSSASSTSSEKDSSASSSSGSSCLASSSTDEMPASSCDKEGS
jgi:hypothetical protein